MAALSRDEFDAIEFDAACSGDYQAAARRMSTLAVTGTQTDSMPRAEAFLRSGEQWLLADNPAEAARGFRMAMADGGPVFVDPRVPLARALFLLGSRSEAYELIDKLKSEGRNDPRVCDLIAELLVDCSDLQEALDWATAGVELCLSGAASAAASHGDGAARPTTRPSSGSCSACGTGSAMTSGSRRTATTSCWTTPDPAAASRPGISRPAGLRWAGQEASGQR